MGGDREGGYGWVIVAGSFTAHLVAFGILYSFTVFFPSIVEEFEQGRGQTSWIVAIASALMLGTGGITGKLADRFGPRPVMMAGAVLVGAGLYGSASATRIEHVYIAYGVCVGLGAGACFVPAVATVGGWFQRRRGLATGIAVAGSGVGTLILAPLSSTLIGNLGWRGALRTLGVGAVIALLLAASVMKSRAKVPRGSARDVIRGDSNFRLMAGSSMIASFGYWVPFVHIVPYARDHGISSARAATLVAIMGAANTVGRVVMGAVADRVGRRPMMQFASVVLMTSLFLWPLAVDWGTLAVFAGVYGAFAGAFIALLPAMAGDYFGIERLAGVTGLLFSAAALGSLFGGPVAGMLYDAQQSYTTAILLAAASMAVGTIALLILPPPPRRQPSADVAPSGVR